MNSFYGGKHGNSFIIAKTYTSIAEMVEDFGKGKTNSPVNFDEYVLINTINKNNPENGQIFRRGYDYNSDRTITSFNPTYENENPYATTEVEANGAVYIGTIVGPAGRAPIFHFDHYDKVSDLSKYKTLNPNLLITYALRRTGETTVAALLSKHYKYKSKIDVDVILSELNFLSKENNFHELLSDMVEEDMDLQQFYYLKLGQPTTPIASLALDYVDIYLMEELNIDENAYKVYYYYDVHYQNNQEIPSDWYLGDLIPIQNSDTFHTGGSLIPGVTYAYDDEGNILYDISETTGKRSMRKGINELGNTYQDTIDWTYCTVRNENFEDSTAYIGFRFGSPVIEFETESVSPYYNRSDIIKNGLPDETADKTKVFENLNLITRNQSKEDIEAHPFYSLWKIAIPKGIKGECIHNLRVVNAYSDVMAFDLDKDGNFRYNEIGEIQVKDYDGKQDDIDNQRKIIVFDYVCYDRIPEGEWHTIYLEDFNKIDGITVADDGTITLDYSHDDTVIYSKLIHWIDDMQFDEDGTVTVIFNNDDLNTDQIKLGVLSKPYLFHWINQMNFAEDGTVTIVFNNEDLNNGQIENGKINLPHLIKWIESVKLNDENGKFEIDFNYENENDGTPTHYENNLTWLKYFDVDEQGNVTYTYTHDTDTSISRIDPHFIKWIKDISLDENTGHFIVNFNYDNEADTGVATQINQFLTWIKDIQLDEDGTVKWSYTTSEDDYQKDNYIKWIKDVTLNTENGRFEVTFNYDTAEKPTTVTKDLTWVKNIHVNADGSVTYTRTTDEITQTENPLTWITGFTFEDNGDLRVTFNNGTIDTIEKNIQWINDIVINDSYEGNQKLSIKYNNADNYVDIGSPLNYVIRMAVNPADGNLLALYSDPQKRQSGYEYGGVSGWTILGNLKYSKTLLSSTYDSLTPAERVSNLITGAVCYSIEEID